MVDEKLRALTEVDRFIHEPSRSVILAILAVTKKADFLYLQRETSLTKGNLSIHLQKLEAAGYIDVEKTYRNRKPLTVCRITPQGRQAFNDYRKQLMNFVEGTDQN